MAVCVIGATLDSDTGQVVPACNVHCWYAPCPANGKPASTVPVETTDELGRFKALQFWAARTKQQRPFVLHHGSWGDDRDHDGRDCWCRPEWFAAIPVLPDGEAPRVDLAGGVVE
jgi:hypothetical protein